MIRNRKALHGAIAGLLAAAFAPIGLGAARADVQIDYDLSRSRITTFGGLVELTPSDGLGTRLGGASARITVPGDLLDPQDGPALLEDFRLGEVPISENLFDLVFLVGNAEAEQVGVAMGELVGESQVVLSTEQPFAMSTSGSVVCTPAEYCSAVGAFPMDLAGIQSLTPLAFELRNLEVDGRSTVRGTLQLDFDGQTASVDLIGVERHRQFVPEPAAMAQLAFGGLALLALRRLPRSRRARRG